MRLSSFTVLSAVAALGYALPSAVQTRDVPSDELSQFKFWVQYAAASYCQTDYTAQVGTKVSCTTGNCPDVEAAGATIIYDFSKYANRTFTHSINAYTYTSSTTATDTAGYIAVDDTNKAVVIAFRGSYSVRNWFADASFPYVDPGLCGGCFAELGFWSSWTNVRDDVTAQLEDALSQNQDYDLVIVGHSLGAAVATLAAADLRTKGHESAKLYAFASPRVANPTLAKFITAQNNNYRFTHQNDPVPKLPVIAMGYAHVSPEYWITSADNTTVTASDIDIVDGILSLDGNTGTGVPLISDFHAHHWYFGKTDDCLNDDLPFKR
ncbi:hypothetical protein PENANT_c027G07118 [Penicillium antarcticum]|uniref:Fungal lipase-like domain-containing protein n=1 Tax=Penicillium antarcticum TaxID=416450 RepID=A0A1V6PYB2_9EURO|nr:uncharacterized protein N7508_003274 [Penicillium antarcticum]KAJ5312444.1 hypothetical protein N7508_003274 [Penicillium antarcticum]OQD81466.1 hypothetical protein PENANT_c027G07118 [Penicillium antarcticum]